MVTREPEESSAVPSEPEKLWFEFSPEGCPVATSLRITAHGKSGTGEEDKSFNPKFYHIRKGGAWKIQESLVAKSGPGEVYRCPCPSGTQISAVFNVLHGFSDDVQKARYSRGAGGKAEYTIGKACTYVASQLSEFMMRNMSRLEKQDAIDFEASVFNANGEKMMTCHLEARMAKTSKASKATFVEQLRRKREEESAKLDSRSGKASWIEGIDTDDEDFWKIAIGINDETSSQE